MSRAEVGRVDEERVRKVAADNPDLLHCRLAQRFGISVHRVRQILGVSGGGGELLHPGMFTHYTPLPVCSRPGHGHRMRLQGKRDHVRKKLRAEEDGKRTTWDPDFKPMRRPNGRGGP